MFKLFMKKQGSVSKRSSSKLGLYMLSQVRKRPWTKGLSKLESGLCTPEYMVNYHKIRLSMDCLDSGECIEGKESLGPRS